MSKRHQSSRRKTYGRRQHEIRERLDRYRDDPLEPAFEPLYDARADDRTLFGLGLGGRRLGFALRD